MMSYSVGGLVAAATRVVEENNRFGVAVSEIPAMHDRKVMS